MERLISKIWRIFATGLCFVLFGLGAFSLSLLFSLFVYPLPINRARKQWLTRYTIRRAFQTFIWVMRGLGLLTLQISLFDRLPPNSAAIDGLPEVQSGRLIIANHPTLLDVAFIISVIPNVSCVVKQALWKNPFTFAMVSMAGYIPNNVDDLIEVAAAMVRGGEQLIIFPEATRTQQLGEFDFKRGTAHIAILAKKPITPVIIKCNPMTLRKGESWYQVPASAPVFSIHIMQSILIDEHVDETQPRSIQVRRLTQYLAKFYAQQLI